MEAPAAIPVLVRVVAVLVARTGETQLLKQHLHAARVAFTLGNMAKKGTEHNDSSGRPPATARPNAANFDDDWDDPIDSPARPLKNSPASTDEGDAASSAQPASKVGTSKLSAWAKNLQRAAIVFAIIGILLIGAALGQVFWPRPSTANIGDFSFPDVQPADAVTAALPNVVGMSESDARSAVADTGVTDLTVTTDTKVAAGDVGTVVAQTPAAGTPLADTKNLTLTLSQEALMPEVTNLDRAEAVKAVENLSGLAIIEYVVSPSVAPGKVVSTVPDSAQPMPAQVLLRVADIGANRSADDVDKVTANSCSFDSNVSSNGTKYDQALVCSPSTPGNTTDDSAHYEWLIGKHASYLTFSAGVSDVDDAGSGTFTIFGDGKLIKTVDVGFGQSTQVQIPVNEFIRLKVVAAKKSDKDIRLVLGNPMFGGTEEELAKIS